MSQYSVPLKKIVEELGITVLRKSSDFDTRVITSANVDRPALQLAGVYNYFDPARLQVIGRVESTFLESLTEDQRRKSFNKFMSYDIHGIIICHDCQPFPECLEMAEKYDRNVMIVEDDTAAFMADLIDTLTEYLAPRVTIHGVLVEIFGEGVLIKGDSGAGKSETALALISQGHRLVADDAVEIKRLSKKRLQGNAPELIRYYMELRGIGIINARDVYGARAVKPSANIDLIINLEYWDETKFYDRLGLDTEYEDIMGVKVPCLTIPVRPGRNLGIIIELATMNNRMKKMGQNAAQNLEDEMSRLAGM
ncbi:MAG: HPr(Ser) kinase/phosphatase [Oscillospiraceae bacterium]|nr:HPr(Ser) kinase/phosphatase [Oscillospiraceae bacterium]